MKTCIQIGFILTIMLFFAQCSKDQLQDLPNDSTQPIDQIQFPDRFDFSTTKIVDINLSAPDVFIGSIFEISYMNNDKSSVFISRGTFDEKSIY